MIRLIHYKKYYKIKLGPSPHVNCPSSPRFCTSLLVIWWQNVLFTSTNYHRLDYSVTCLYDGCVFLQCGRTSYATALSLLRWLSISSEQTVNQCTGENSLHKCKETKLHVRFYNHVFLKISPKKPCKLKPVIYLFLRDLPQKEAQSGVL